MAHVLVVGSGIAGLITAIRAARRHQVTIVTKDVLTAGSTAWAQGGIAAAVFGDDSPELHARDTIEAGAGLCDPRAVEILCSEGPARIRDLVTLGVDFDAAEDSGTAANADGWARGLEAAHSVARVLHAGGDATGRVIETALAAAVREGRIRTREFSRVTAIIVTDGVTRGAMVDGPDGLAVVDADAVVLATGGNGRLFRHTTNPPVATGDGIVLAYAAGAAIADLEFVQFHPTVLAGGGLVSEAVRGEGATLLDAEGRRFLFDIDPRGELAPRDVVARAIAARMAAQRGAPVLLDATALGERMLVERFPTIDRLVRAAGFDWTREPIPVTPAAHYSMGGALTDMDGRTTVPGLFAVGETGSTGVHGANRLASNSLLEALVVGWRAGDIAGESVDTWAGPEVEAGAGEAADAEATVGGATDTDEPDTASPALTPLTVSDALVHGRTPWTADRVRDRAWDALGLVRDGEELSALIAEFADARPADEEAATLLPLARLTAAAALARTESRGAHDRRDYPRTDPAQRVRRAIVRPVLNETEQGTAAGLAAAHRASDALQGAAAETGGFA